MSAPSGAAQWAPGRAEEGAAEARPAVSVIVSTYNWSSALRCALRSVQLQTRSDIEVLVVGDGCTDDSEDVVHSFDDPRFHWHNLPRNVGSQSGPNNRGIELARSHWVAYLGQDDLWHPRHLEACLAAASARDADFVASLTIMYGPPGSGWRAMSGLLVDGVYGPDDFMPPSSWMHRRSLVDKIGSWKAPHETPLPIDAAFLQDAARGGATIVGTDEVTVFKFNAAWRRDAYRLKPTAEQETMLARIEAGGDFRERELVDVLKAVAADRYIPVRMPQPPGPGEMSYFRRNRLHKGAESRFARSSLQPVDRVMRFKVEEPGHFEWHTEEAHPVHGSFRWSGPSPRSTMALPVLFDRKLAVRIHLLGAIEDSILRALRLSVQGVEVPFEIETTAQGTLIVHGICPRPAATPDALEISLDVGRTRRPVDVMESQDRRWLGVAVNWIEVGPT